EVVVVGLADDALRVGDGFEPARGVVAEVSHQHRVAAGGHGARLRPRSAAVGADLYHGGRAVSLVGPRRRVARAGLNTGRWRAELASAGLVVEALPRGRLDDIAVSVVAELGLFQHRVARHVIRVGVARIAAAIGGEGLRHAARAVVLILH